MNVHRISSQITMNVAADEVPTSSIHIHVELQEANFTLVVRDDCVAHSVSAGQIQVLGLKDLAVMRQVYELAEDVMFLKDGQTMDLDMICKVASRISRETNE